MLVTRVRGLARWRMAWRRQPGSIDPLRHGRLVPIVLGTLLSLPSQPARPACSALTAGAQARMSAVGRSLAWLEAHPPDPGSDPLGDVCLDVWSWHLLSTLHPDERVRRHAWEETGRRLARLPRPGSPTVVSMSYWATLTRILALRGEDIEPYRKMLVANDLAAIVATATPTTRLWITELLRRSGLPVARPGFSGTLIAAGTTMPASSYLPTKRDAYRIFHEIVPLTDLGREHPRGLAAEQVAFIRRALPGLLEVSLAAGDTDAVAEVLVAAALMGERDSPSYRRGTAWILGRQRPDGTYFSDRDRQRVPLVPGQFRHVVLVATWAVLTAP